MNSIFIVYVCKGIKWSNNLLDFHNNAIIRAKEILVSIFFYHVFSRLILSETDPQV